MTIRWMISLWCEWKSRPAAEEYVKSQFFYEKKAIFTAACTDIIMHTVVGIPSVDHSITCIPAVYIYIYIITLCHDKRNSNQGRVQSTSPSANTNPAPNSNIFDAFADITTTSPYDPPPPHGGYGYPPHHDDYKEYHEQQPVMNNFQQPGIYSEYSYQSGGHQQMPVAWNNDGIQQQGGFCQQHVFDDNGGRPFGCGEISSKSYEPTQMQCPTQKRGEVNSTIAAGPAQLMQPSVASLNPFDIW